MYSNPKSCNGCKKEIVTCSHIHLQYYTFAHCFVEKMFVFIYGCLCHNLWGKVEGTMQVIQSFSSHHPCIKGNCCSLYSWYHRKLNSFWVFYPLPRVDYHKYHFGYYTILPTYPFFAWVKKNWLGKVGLLLCLFMRRLWCMSWSSSIRAASQHVLG